MYLDPMNVPEEVRSLIPMAEKWGVADDIDRAILSVEGASQAELLELSQCLDQVNDGVLSEWLEGPEFNSDNPTEEYTAFTCLSAAVDHSKVLLNKHNEDNTLPKQYEYASLSARVIGTFIDGVVVFVLFIGSVMLLKALNANNAYTIMTVVFLCYIFYFTWPISKYGYTPGYKILKIEVIRTNGQHLGIAQSFIRYVAKTILGIISLLAYGSEKRQCIHDMIVDTIVIKKT
jgi:uncharacterized RDD family membrane protein YckC